MARSRAELIVKKNTKLETFLKRNLDVDTYEKIRAHDSCIVCSEKEDKAFKFIVLTDEWIYLTENPPKKIYEAVHMKDLVSVELINDYPNFLQGEERQNTQHLVVKYLTDGSTKRKKGRSARKDKDETLYSCPEFITPSSARSPPINPIIKPYSCRSLSARETKEMKLMTAQQLLAELQRSQTDSNIFNSMQDSAAGKRVQFSQSSPAALMQNDIRPNSADVSSPRKQSLSSPSSPSNQTTKKKHEKQTKSFAVDSPRSNGTGSKLTPRTKGELKLDLSKLEMSEDEEDEKSTASDEANKNSKFSKTKRSHLPDIHVTECDQSEHIREVTMHVYVMNARSKILMLIQSAKHNYLMRGTLEKDPKYVLKTTVITPRSAQASSEKLEFLFRQLKTELQYRTNTMIDNFFHIHELKVAAERNFALRKLFWKTPDVFKFMVKQLKVYMPMYSSCLKKYSEENIKLARADELEYLILILETLSIVFRETEIVPTRIEMLKSEAGHISQQLIISLVSCPEVPESSLTYESDVDSELRSLLKEYRNMSTAVLFELLIIGEQATWCDSETTLLKVSWIVKQLGDKKQIEPFLEHIIMEAMAVLATRRLELVTPSKAVLLYQQFHILKTLTYFDTDLTSFMREKFYEEFKYYIQAPVLESKLPESYPLRPKILRLMEEVVGQVLQKSVRLLSS